MGQFKTAQCKLAAFSAHFRARADFAHSPAIYLVVKR
jgi:hypothetical protein